MKTTIRAALGLVSKERRRRLAVVALLALLVSGLEVVSAFMVLLILQLTLEQPEAVVLPLIGSLGDRFPAASAEDLVLGASLVFVVFFVLRAGVFLFQQYATNRVAENTGVMLAHRLVDGYLSMPYEFHLTRSSSELIRNAYDNVQQVVNSVFIPMIQLFAESFLVLAMLMVLFFVSPLATTIAAVVVTAVVIAILSVVQPRLQRLGRERQTAAASALELLQQGFGGLRDLKVLGRERTFSHSFRRARMTMASSAYWRATLAYAPRAGLETVFLLIVVSALAIATVQGRPAAALSTLGLFAYAGIRVQPSLQKIASGLNSLRFADAAISDLSADLVLLDAHRAERERVDADPQPLPFLREIRFEDVDFAYQQASSPALAEVNLVIQKGEAIGICGHTGSGKSTLLDLLCGLLAPTAGRITVDGVDVASNARAWQRNIGVVHQSSFLIDDTLQANIALGVPASEVQSDRVAAAIRAAQLSEVVSGLPDGLATIVGERGARLSGGQRQRVALARALYRQPSLLVLDEGTSALDRQTEAAVVQALESLEPGTTRITVAHRLATIRDCDRIIFLDNSRIAGIGTYNELLSSHAGFRTLADGKQAG